MSRYNAEFPFPVAFPPQQMTNVLAEWLSKHDVKQAHIAGAHVSHEMPPVQVADIMQRRRNTPTSPSSSTAASKSNSKAKKDI